jgi:mRNA interferase ChpB
MHTTRLKRVGGSVMLTVPPALLNALSLGTDNEVGMVIDNGRLIVEPYRRPQYSLAELLAQCDPNAEISAEEREWLDAPATGQEKSDMERGEIWLVSLDPTAGHEQQGTRPVLIVTPAAFNRVTRLPVVVPVTSGGNFARTAGFAVSLDGVGIRTTGVVRCDQPRTIDMKARGGKRLERVPETIMNEVLGRLSTILT